jgi:hypothetical protein
MPPVKPVEHTKTTRYPVLKNIIYHNPESEFNNKLVRPGDPITENGMTFPHLDEAGIRILQRKRFLGPAIVAKSKK